MVTCGGRASRQKKQPVPSTEVEEGQLYLGDYDEASMAQTEWVRDKHGMKEITVPTVHDLVVMERH